MDAFSASRRIWMPPILMQSRVYYVAVNELKERSEERGERSNAKQRDRDHERLHARERVRTPVGNFSHEITKSLDNYRASFSMHDIPSRAGQRRGQSFFYAGDARGSRVKRAVPRDRTFGIRPGCAPAGRCARNTTGPAGYHRLSLVIKCS